MDAVFEIGWIVLKCFVLYPLWFIYKTIESAFSLLLKKKKKEVKDVDFDVKNKLQYFGKYTNKKRINHG